MASAKYFSESGGMTTGAVSSKTVRYPAGIFECVEGDLAHCAEVEDFDPAKNGVHYEAAKDAGLIPENEESEPTPYPTVSMKAARPRRKKATRSKTK